MRDPSELRSLLLRIDGESYKRYKEIKGAYGAGDGYALRIDYVQGDPYAQPSRVRVHLDAAWTALPDWSFASADRRRATADHLNRGFSHAVRAASTRHGSGRGGELRVLQPGQEVLERTSVRVDEGGGVEARFRVGLPARGRRILGRAAALVLLDAVPGAVGSSLRMEALDAAALEEHVECVEDAVALRSQLAARGLVAFVADGALLPRRSGVDDRPLARERARAFESPPSLRTTLTAPNAGAVTGLGVPLGVTLIVGGGYHGKSTLLNAIERGVYDHVPGDGRERVVTRPLAMKVRAEDGRRVAGTDISNFVRGLPGGEDTVAFRSEDASGSTSQAAAIVEALEVGAEALLLDEDTSATNFMIRDARMQALVPREAEPITPFIDRARQLAAEQGVSTVLVVGGAGDYFDVADTVVAMREYRPYDYTSAARDIARRLPTRRTPESGAWRPIRRRRPRPDGLTARGRAGRERIRVHAADRLEFGEERVDLSALEQIVEAAQVAAMARALQGAAGAEIDGEREIDEALRRVMDRIAAEGPGAFDAEPKGEYAGFRILELAGLLNRLRQSRID